MKDAETRPAQAGDGASAARAERLLTIGQVVKLLQAEYPDLSITKLRYLEDRGLLSPTRTKGRYRKYDPADVRRLRMILTLQRDDYLPLEVIRQKVDRSTAAGSGTSAGAVVVAGRSGAALRREEPAYSLAELCDAVGVKPAFIDTLLEYRLIEKASGEKVSQTVPIFTESDLETVRICHLLTRFGVEPRHLRLLSSSTEREATVIEQIVTPSLLSTHADKREYGEKMLSDLATLFSQLLHLLLYKELRRLL
jgi:DNA-binding transcriptional MerR regulator